MILNSQRPPLYCRPQPVFYRPSFTRHLHGLAISGFYARGLDADDFAFLESVRTKGIANGSLPGNSAVLIEELDFWNTPYALDSTVERKVGPVSMYSRIIGTPEQLDLRRARSRAFQARRTIKEQYKAMADAELAREQREWQKANAERQRRAIMSDAEWEAAAPAIKALRKGQRLKFKKKLPFGKMVKQHYVPQWKVDEQNEAQLAEVAARMEQQRLLNEQRKAQLVIERAAKQEQAAVERMRRAVERQQDDEQIRRNQIIEEARQTVDRVNRLEREWTNNPLIDLNHLKRAIYTLLHNTAPTIWTADMLVRALGCTEESIHRCLHEMQIEGRLRKIAA